ncbi:MAG: zf-HC2 domain-containing protein [Desulfomonilaceae bacterium]
MRKIDCGKAEKLMVTDLDEGLGHGKRLILEHHLSGCASCREMHNQTKSLLSDLTTDTLQDPGDAFWQYYRTSLDARLRDKDISSSSLFWRTRAWRIGWKPVGVFVTAILIFMVISVGIFDTWNFRPYTDSTLSAQLIGELNQLYGPVTDEQAYFAVGAEELGYPQTSQLIADDSLVEWFEVEDEANQLFL